MARFQLNQGCRATTRMRKEFTFKHIYVCIYILYIYICMYIYFEYTDMNIYNNNNIYIYNIYIYIYDNHMPLIFHLIKLGNHTSKT